MDKLFHIYYLRGDRVKKLILMSIICMLIGIALVISTRGYMNANIPYLKELQWKRFAEQDINYAEVFWKLLWERAKLFLIIGLLASTRWREKLLILLLYVGSFVVGYWMATIVINMGIKGILIVLASLLPHGPVYVLGIIICLKEMENTYYRYDIHLLRQIGQGLVICGIFIVGCMAETIIGTRLLLYVARVMFLR